MAKRKTKPQVADPSNPFPWIPEPLQPFAEPMGNLVIDPRNARTHDEANIQSLMASLREFGQRQLIVANRTNGQIVAGNGRYMAAQRIGWTHLAVLWVEDDAAAQRGYSLADNRTAELAGWDDGLLQELLGEVEDSTPDLYADLLLDELRQIDPAGGEEAEAKGEETEKTAGVSTATYQVLVECDDYRDRDKLMKKLRREGRVCQSLTCR
jgi:hypothetical protein